MIHRARIHRHRNSDDGQTGGWSVDLLYQAEEGILSVGEAWEPTWPRALAVAEAYVRTGDPYPSDQLVELWERRMRMQWLESYWRRAG